MDISGDISKKKKKEKFGKAEILRVKMCAFERVTEKESFALKINGFRRILGGDGKRVKNAHFLARGVHDFFLIFMG